MKTAGAIKHKLNQVRFRYLKKRLDAELRQAPANCKYNVPVPVEDDLTVGMGMCLYGAGDVSSWKPSFCDERLDDGERARACSLFCPRRSKDEVKDDFKHALEGMSLPEVAFQYPDMAALIWVLDEEDVTSEEPVEGTTSSNGVADHPVSEPHPHAPPTPHVPPLQGSPVEQEEKRPWWARWLGVGT